MTADLYRLPAWRDAQTGRKLTLRSSQYTVVGLTEDGAAATLARSETLAHARSLARIAVGMGYYARIVVAKPAGLLDDPDYLEEITA